MPSVGVPRLLRYHLGDQPSTEVSGRTLGEALEELFKGYPLLARHVTDEAGALRAHVVVALNGKVLGARPDLGTPVSDADEIAILQAVSGG